MKIYLGIDLGTTGLKAVLVKPDGEIAAVGYREYPVLVPSPGYAEQDPRDWWRALVEALGDAMGESGTTPADICGIGFSGQMHGTVLLDDAGEILAPAIIWCDQRSVSEVELVKNTLGTEKLGELTQNPISTGFQLASLLWVKTHRPELYEKSGKVLLPKDYLRYRMTGEYGSEPTDACSTLLLDCRERTWSGEILSTFDINPAILPQLGKTPMEVAGLLTQKAAGELGLCPGIPVVYGGGDQPMQAIGNGILSPGDASVTLGTGGQVFVPSAAPSYDPALRTHTFCHGPENLWYVMGATLNCCLAQNWFFDKVLGDRNFAELHARAARVPMGSEGLYFLPYLTGERTPHMNPMAKGVFFGLTLGHDREVMTRAVVEGISYALRDAMATIENQNIPVNRIFLSGGGAKSPLWRQILADMLGRPAYTTTMREEAGVGAAICAMVGNGEYTTLEEACGRLVCMDPEPTWPQEEATAFYREGLETFRALYRANAPFFR